MWNSRILGMVGCTGSLDTGPGGGGVGYNILYMFSVYYDNTYDRGELIIYIYILTFYINH